MTKKTKRQWLVVSLIAAGISVPVVVRTQTPAPAAPAVELTVGDPAPAFSLPGTDGKTHTLAQYKGKAGAPPSASRLRRTGRY